LHQNRINLICIINVNLNNMRKKYHVLKMLGVAFAILFIAISVNAQDNKEKPASSSFSPYWFLNGHVGFSEFYGDLNKFRFFSESG